MLRLPAIDDDIVRTASRSQQRNICCRINSQSRAKRKHKIRFFGSRFRALQIFISQVLAETDGGRLEESAALTNGRAASVPEMGEVRVRVRASATGLTLDRTIRAVQFDQPVSSGPGAPVQTVDILCDDRHDSAGAFQLNNRSVGCIRLRVPKRCPCLKLVIPMFDARLLRAHEIMIINGLSSLPDTVWTAKVWDATAG